MTVKNVIEASGTFQSNVEPTWSPDTATSTNPISAASSHPKIGVDGSNITGRASYLSDVFKAADLGLTSYVPKDTYVSILNGSNSALAVGTTVTDGAGQYFGASVTNAHLTYANTPSLADVQIADLNIPNPYVPDVSNGAITDWSAEHAATFLSKYPGTQNSYPPASGRPGVSLTVDNNFDLNAGDGTLDPAATATRVGGWFTDTSLNYGRWTND